MYETLLKVNIITYVQGGYDLSDLFLGLSRMSDATRSVQLFVEKK